MDNINLLSHLITLMKNALYFPVNHHDGNQLWQNTSKISLYGYSSKHNNGINLNDAVVLLC